MKREVCALNGTYSFSISSITGSSTLEQKSVVWNVRISMDLVSILVTVRKVAPRLLAKGASGLEALVGRTTVPVHISEGRSSQTSRERNQNVCSPNPKLFQSQMCKMVPRSPFGRAPKPLRLSMVATIISKNSISGSPL
jgi:hypothetical protein